MKEMYSGEQAKAIDTHARKFGTYVRRNENTACNCFGM